MASHQFSATKILMLSLSALSIIILISSTSWVFTWLALELNMFTFLPIMMWDPSKWVVESGVKYFIIQSSASSLFLLSSLTLSKTPSLLMSTLLLTTLLMKLAAAPTHQWLIMVVKPLSWQSVLMLLTWQKLGPLIILLSMLMKSWESPFMWLSTLNVALGAAGGLNQSHMRPLLAFSSISHMGWVLISAPLSTYKSLVYFLIYSSTTALFILSFNTNKNYKFWWGAKLYYEFNIITIINMLSMAGAPPLLGFAGKWLIISSSSSLLLMMFIILMTILTLFFYLSISINITLAPPPKPTPKPVSSTAPTLSILLNLLLAPIILLI